MKIRKVDDKPMVIHTKEKAKIHAHEPKGAKIKGSRRIGRDTLVNIKELNKYIVEEQERERYEKMNAKYLKEDDYWEI